MAKALIYAASIPQAIQWAKEAKIGSAAASDILAFYKKHKDIIDPYRGGLPGPSVASGLKHESGFDPLHTSDPIIGESGLWSITPGVAIRYDIDPFDMEANIFAGCRMRNVRVKEILERYPWLAEADPYDYTKLTQKLPGSFGIGGFHKVMAMVGLDRRPSGAALYRPYLYMRQWVENPANWSRIPKIGRMSPKVIAGRIVRSLDVDWLKATGHLAPKGYAIVGRPSHLPKFDKSRYAAVWGPAIKRVMLGTSTLYKSWAKQLVGRFGESGVQGLIAGDPDAWKAYFRRFKGTLAADLYTTVSDVFHSIGAGSPRGIVGVIALAAIGASFGAVGYWSYRDRHNYVKGYRQLQARWGWLP